MFLWRVLPQVPSLTVSRSYRNNAHGGHYLTAVTGMTVYRRPRYVQMPHRIRDARENVTASFFIGDDDPSCLHPSSGCENPGGFISPGLPAIIEYPETPGALK
ncbi:MAG: hypothetical protein PUK76_13500 [Treponema sp.]|nr:hypothetical protein [Treponema sp.]